MKYLLLIAVVLLVATVTITYIWESSAEGSFTIHLPEAPEPYGGLLLKPPVTSEGPIYRITEVTVTVVSSDGVTEVTPELTYTDGVIESIYIPIGGTGPYTIEGRYVVKEEKIIDYSKYPWDVYVGGEKLTMPIEASRNIVSEIALRIKENHIYIIPALLLLTAGLTAGIYLSRPGGVVYQQAPAAPAAGKKCDWCRVCLIFLKIDSRKKTGEYLGEEYVRKLMKALTSLNKLWEKCCIRFVPCIKKGKVMAHYLNPDKVVSIPVAEGSITTSKGKQIGITLHAKINLKKLFKGEGHNEIELEGGEVKTKVKIVAKGVLKEAFKGPGGRTIPAGTEVPSGEVSKEADAIAKNTNQAAKKKFFELVRDASKGEVEKEWKINIAKALEELAIQSGYGEECVKIFILELKRPGGRGEYGYALIPGRSVIMKERGLLEPPVYLLAHELGHSLSLVHVQERNNVMNPEVNGGDITKEQCGKAYDNCKKDKLKHYNMRKCGRGEDLLKKYEKEREIELLKEELEEAEKEAESIKGNITRVGREKEKLEEIKKQLKEILKKLEREEKTINLKKRTYRRKPKEFDKWVKKQLKKYEEDLKKARETLQKYREKGRKSSYYRRRIGDKEKKVAELEALLKLYRNPENAVKSVKESIREKEAKIKEAENELRRLSNSQKKLEGRIKELRYRLKKMKK